MAGESLQWNNPSMDLERFQKTSMPLRSLTFGFQGYPAGNMEHYKPPVRAQPSADVTRDVDRYFRRDSPTDRLPSPVKQPPPPQQEERKPPPPLKLEDDRQQKPDWLQSSSRSQDYGDTQRYNDGFNTQRKDIVIYDPLRELTSAERDRKKREVEIAQEDLAEAARRKREREEERKEDQRRIRELQENYRPYGQPGGGAPIGDNRKMKFTEHQLTKPVSPKYNEPPRPRYDPMERESPSRILRDQDMKMDRVRQNLDHVRNGYTEDRREEIMKLLREQEAEIQELRQKLKRLEKGKLDTEKEAKINEGVNQQDAQLMKLQDEIENLRGNPVFMRPAGLPSSPRLELKREINPEIRAHSEPPTDRYAAYRSQRDRDFWGTNRSPQPPYYLSPTSRRVPVGKWYNPKSTYNLDFDEPFYRKGKRNLGNPIKGEYDYHPFGGPGGGAPRLDATGQRTTQVQRSMNELGREASFHEKLKRANKKEELNSLGEQAALDRVRKQKEREYLRQGGNDLAENIRGPQMKVGYPKKKPTGVNDNHHLPHTISKSVQPPPITKQRAYHDFLESQINEREKLRNLDKLRDSQQANLHFIEMDKRFESERNYGGGAPKGLDYRKVKLDRAIHNPQDTSPQYNKVRMYDEAYNGVLDYYKPRITVNSTHKNLYEFPAGNIQLDYRGRAPFAENGSSNY